MIMKKSYYYLLFAVFILLPSCNTVIGVGRDLRQGTDAIGAGIKRGGDSVGEGLENAGHGKSWKHQQ